MSLRNVRPLIDRFSRLNVLVIGDLMLDHYIWGSVSRISPEAPVPVVDVKRETEMPGGAGNVALNLASLGATVHLAGLVGQDAAADRLLRLFGPFPVQTGALLRSASRPTIVKTRIIAHQQQVVRVDREKRDEADPGEKTRLRRSVLAFLPKMDAIVISDYAKGVISRDLLTAVITHARRRRIPITVDPKVENFKWYRGVACVTPNLKEAMEGGAIHAVKSERDVEALGWKLQRGLRAKSILITRGEKGMSLFEQGRRVLHIPTRAQEVFDVTGAGDTVISTFTLAVAAGASLPTAAELANYAAGIVVGKLGTATVTRWELLDALKLPS